MKRPDYRQEWEAVTKPIPDPYYFAGWVDGVHYARRRHRVPFGKNGIAYRFGYMRGRVHRFITT